MKKIKKYFPRKLVDGGRIGLTGTLVAVPDKGFKDCIIEVIFEGKKMIIKDWRKESKTFRFFDDKHGGAPYKLGYFEWNPV